MNIKKTFLIVLTLCYSVGFSQNLIPNPSFESGPCPNDYTSSAFDEFPTSWRVWPRGTSTTTADYFRTGCYTGGSVGQPNPSGAPVSGTSWMGGVCVQKPCTPTQRYIEGMRAPLTTTLTSGTIYEFSIYLAYVAASPNHNGVFNVNDGIGIWIYDSASPPSFVAQLVGGCTTIESQVFTAPNIFIPSTSITASYQLFTNNVTAGTNWNTIAIAIHQNNNVVSRYYVWDDVSLSIPCTPGSNTTPTTAICENGTKTLTATTSDGTWSIVSGGGSIAGTTYTPPNVSSNTSVTVRYTDACGATSDRTFTVNVLETANNSTSTSAICESGTKTLSGTPSGGTWSIVSGGGSITGTTYTPPNVSSNTSVTVRYTIAANGACPATTSDQTFTVNVLETANNTTPTSAICESSTKTLSGTPSGGTWSIVSGGGSISGTTYTPPNVSSNTPVTVRYSIAANGACPGSTSDQTFTVNVQEPAVNTTTTTSICEGSDKALTGTPSGGTWSILSGGGSITGSTYTAPTVTGATSVTVRYTIPANGACPASTDDVTFTVDDNVPPSNTTNTDTICEGGTKALTGTPGGGTFTLLNGSGSITGTTYTAGSISSPDLIEIEYASPAAGSCPAGEDTISFVVVPLPEPIITSVSDTMCEGTTRLLTGTPTGGIWSVVSGTATLTNDTLMPTGAGAVVVQYMVTSTNGCSDSVTQTIESISAPVDPTVTASSDTVCRGEQVTINGSGSGVGITYNVYSTLTGSSWLGVTPYTISPILTTTYYIDANNGTCMNNGGRQPITITVNPLPTVNTNGDQTICPTDQVILTATGGGTYLWSTGSTNDSITVSPLVDTTYYVTVTNSNNCSVVDSIQVTLLNGTIVQAEDDSAMVNTAVDTTIDVYINDNGDPNAITILSGPNNGTGTITSGILNYRSTDDFVGVDTIVYELCDLVCPLLCDTAIVYLTVERDLFIPAFFSPNGDNINDEFIILGLEKYLNNNIKIFNRWGSLVYQSEPFTSWDGMSEGIILSGSSTVPAGTYYYILDLGDNSEPVVGYLIIK